MRNIIIPAMESAIGNVNQTPLIWKKIGNIRSRGTNKMTCRRRDKNMETLALPRAWYSPAATIWKPRVGKNKIIILVA